MKGGNFENRLDGVQEFAHQEINRLHDDLPSFKDGLTYDVLKQKHRPLQLERILQEPVQNQSGSAKATTYQGVQDENSPANFISAAVFLIIFIAMMYLMKRYVAKFLSFYLVRRDYQRLKCVERSLQIQQQHGQSEPQNTLKSQNSPTNMLALQGAPQLRRMNHAEIMQVYSKTFKTSLKLYHPLFGISSKQLQCLQFTLNLPRTIIFSLFLATVILAITLSLGLLQGLCSPSPGSAECFSQKLGAVTLLDALITASVMIFLTSVASRNYLEFLEAVRYPYLAQSLDFNEQEQRRSSAIRASQVYIAQQQHLTPGMPQTPEQQYLVAPQAVKPNSSQSSQRASRQNSLASNSSKQPQAQLKNQDNNVLQTMVQPLGNGPYLFSIKEDDEEAPLSPDKHSGRGLDDIGSDEIGHGMYKAPRDSQGMLPPLGLIRSINQDHQTSIIKLKTIGIPNRFPQDTRQHHITSHMNTSTNGGMNHSRVTAAAEINNDTYQRSKTNSAAQSFQHDGFDHHGNDGIHIEDGMEDLEEISDFQKGSNQSQRSYPLPGPNGPLNNLYNRILHAPTITQSNGASTNTPDGMFRITGPAFFSKEGPLQNDVTIEDQNPTPKQGQMFFSGIPQHHYEQRGKILLIISLILVISIMLTPLYVVRQLSIIPSPQLIAVVQGFVYALLLDLALLRFLLLSLVSVIHARLKLKGIGCMVPVSPPNSVLGDDQVMLLGDFYQTYDPAQSVLTQENSARSLQPEDQMYSDEEEANRDEAYIDKNFRSTARKLLLNSNRDKGKDVIHQTLCPGIYFLEVPQQQYCSPITPLRQQGREILSQMTPDDNGIEIGFQGAGTAEDLPEENLADTSKRLLGISKLNARDKTPGRGIDFREDLTPNGALNSSTKILKATSNPLLSGSQRLGQQTSTRQDASFKNCEVANSSFEDDLEEIDINSQPMDRPTQQNRVPPINMALVSSTPPGQPITVSQKAAQEAFETPKNGSFVKKSTNENNSLPAKKTGPMSAAGQRQALQKQTSQSKKLGDTPIDPDLNQSLLDQKKKLLRDLILEASSNDTKNNDSKKENMQEEFQSSLKKYLAEDSAESIELDANGNPIKVKRIKAPGILNDSDIQALWQQQSTAKQLEQFSPKYSSGNKNTVANPFKNGLAKTMPRVIPQPEDKNFSQKGTASNRNDDSFKNNQVRSSSHHTNLLRSVLSQNREQEADLSELVQGSPKDKKRNNGFNSPQERNKTPPLDGSQLKRMKCASIVVREHQPFKDKSGIQRQTSAEYDDVHIQEEDDTGRPVVANVKDGEIGPARQDSSNSQAQRMAQVNFQSEVERAGREEIFDQVLINNKRQSDLTQLTATPGKAGDDQQPQSRGGFGRQKSPGPRFAEKPIILSASYRKKQEDQIRKNLSAQKAVQGDLYSIKESAEYASSYGMKSGSNFTKIHPSTQYEKTPGESYSLKFSSNRVSDAANQSIHTFISAYPGGKMSNRVNFLSGTKKTGVSEDTILEEKSLEMKNDSFRSPSGSPPVVIGGRANFPPEKKPIPFGIHSDNALIGEAITNEAPELAALRRVKRNFDIVGKGSMKPSSIVIPDGDQGSGLEILMNDKRYTSNVRATEKSDNYKPKLGLHQRMASSQSQTRPIKSPNTTFTPQYFDQFGVKQQVPKPVQPPPEYNLHLKEQEQIKQIKEKKEVGQIMIEEQERQLKKFLQLARQLRKGKDEKKIVAIINSMKEQGKPMSLQVINELRMLEIMNSPYSQPLQGMIRTIEQCLNLRDERPSTNQTRRRRQGKAETAKSPNEMGDLSTRRLIKAFEAYNKREDSKTAGGQRNGGLNQVNSLQGASSHLSQMTLSRESSAGASDKQRTKSAGSKIRFHNRSQSNGSQVKSSRMKNRGVVGETMEITDQSYQSSSNKVFSQLQSRNDMNSEHTQSIEDTTLANMYQRSSSYGKTISPSKTPSSVGGKQQPTSKRSSRHSTSKRPRVSSKLGKGAAASQPSRSSMLSPTGGEGQMRRLAMNPSHYSSINQVLIEHDDEESEVSHRNLKQTIEEEVDLERGGVGSARSSPVLQEIEEIVDALSSPDK